MGEKATTTVLRHGFKVISITTGRGSMFKRDKNEHRILSKVTALSQKATKTTACTNFLIFFNQSFYCIYLNNAIQYPCTRKSDIKKRMEKTT